MEVELRETGLARGVLQQDTGLIPGCEEIASATKTPEGIVMEQVWHRGDDMTRAVCCIELILLCDGVHRFTGWLAANERALLFRAVYATVFA
jgi:hypothetical protein